MKTVEIDLKDLEGLAYKAIAYEYLQMMGVDNWQGYDEVDWEEVDIVYEDYMSSYKGENE